MSCSSTHASSKYSECTSIATISCWIIFDTSYAIVKFPRILMWHWCKSPNISYKNLQGFPYWKSSLPWNKKNQYILPILCAMVNDLCAWQNINSHWRVPMSSKLTIENQFFEIKLDFFYSIGNVTQWGQQPNFDSSFQSGYGESISHNKKNNQNLHQLPHIQYHVHLNKLSLLKTWIDSIFY